MITHDFDYIITGAGAAGLSLAYHFNRAGLTDKRILLVDKASRAENDRTWCFWEQGNSPFETIVFRKWKRVAFHGEAFSKVLDLAPYAYKMIRGVDFYRFMAQWLSEQPNITQLSGVVSEFDEQKDGVVARVDSERYQAQWAFNSIRFQPPLRQPNRHYLLQHFLGWVIQTPERAFNPAVATLMDFRVDQADDTRFMYVLPFDEHTALVEYTVFSSELLPRDEYKRQLERYISDQLRLTHYEEQHEEFGVIPMTDSPFAGQPSPHVINIGTAGGRTKPSTGYTFQRIQRQSQQIAKALKTTGSPIVAAPLANKRKRYGLFDSVLLNVLAEGRDQGKRVFTDLFSRNPPQRVLKFLDEDTSLAEDVQIMRSVNIPAFLAATGDSLRRRIFAMY